MERIECVDCGRVFIRGLCVDSDTQRNINALRLGWEKKNGQWFCKQCSNNKNGGKD